MGLRILVVDDSLIYRRILADVARKLPGVEEVVTANDGKQAIRELESRPFDAALVDHHMPGMTGLELLAEMKKRWPEVAAIMVSSGEGEGADLTVRALEAGALEFVQKPSGTGYGVSVRLLQAELGRVFDAVRHRLRPGAPVPRRPAGNGSDRAPAAPARKAPVDGSRAAAPARPVPAATPARPAPRPASRAGRRTRDPWIVAIGVSTGGPQALTKVIPALPGDYPLPIVMVQHMPPVFTASLAKRLDDLSALRVREAAAGDVAERGTVLLAPGGRHMKIVLRDGKPVVELSDEPPVNSCRPAVDVLFRSLAACPEERSVLAVIMTGMGQDGLEGVRALKESGACWCITQSADTCVVYGMPRAVDEAGLSDESVPLERIAERLVAKAALAGVGTR